MPSAFSLDPHSLKSTTTNVLSVNIIIALITDSKELHTRLRYNRLNHSQ